MKAEIIIGNKEIKNPIAKWIIAFMGTTLAVLGTAFAIFVLLPIALILGKVKYEN